MKNILSTILLVLVIAATSCTNKKQAIPLPDNAFPIVYHGHLYVKGDADSIQGNFVFDTGASNFYYDSTYFAGNEYFYTDYFSALLPGAGATPQKVEVIKDTVTFEFGEHLYRTNIVPILQLKPILGDFADGILGMEYFYGSVLEINYEREYMCLYRSLDSIDTLGYDKIKLSKKGNRLFIPLQVNINDSLSIAGEYQVDFGCGGSVVLTSATTRKYNLSENIKNKTAYFTKYGGVGGESSSYDFRTESVQIGDFEFANVCMDFSIDKSGALSSNKHLGLLGNGIYERFNVFIDFINNDMYLKPNGKYEEPFEFSKLSFSYVDRNKTMDAWIVTGLYRNCNAEKAGLKIDDKIIAVNGTSVKQITYESQKGFWDDLTSVNLAVKRGVEQMEIKFKLEPIQ